MIITCGMIHSNIKVLNIEIVISNKLIRHVLLIKSKYRVKFLNCISLISEVRKLGEIRPYIINKKMLYMGVIHLCT